MDILISISIWLYAVGVVAVGALLALTGGGIYPDGKPPPVWTRIGISIVGAAGWPAALLILLYYRLK